MQRIGKINFGAHREQVLYQVHRRTAMLMLSGPALPKGAAAIDAVHPIPVSTTVKLAGTHAMEGAFRSIVNFDPMKDDEIQGVTQLYRRLGSSVEESFHLAMTIAEGVQHDNYWGLAFSDGMRAITSLLEFQLQVGDEIITSKPLYGCTDNYFSVESPRRGQVVRVVDLSDPENLLEVLNPKTRIIYFETMTNPNLRVYDLETISRLARGANPNVVIIVDNTFPGPAGCNPLLHGANMVVHSATKILGGFCQEMAGVAIIPKNSWKELFLYRKNTGGVPAPEQIHALLTRGLPTLYDRQAQMQSNAAEIASYLEMSSHIQEVAYPGLESYLFRDNAVKLLRDWNGHFAPGFMIAFVPAGGTEEARESRARKIVDFLAEYGHGIITHAVSLGGVKSLVEMPFLGTHAAISTDEKKKWGIEAGLIRLSVGLAQVGDQLELLEAAIRQT